MWVVTEFALSGVFEGKQEHIDLRVVTYRRRDENPEEHDGQHCEAKAKRLDGHKPPCRFPQGGANQGGNSRDHSDAARRCHQAHEDLVPQVAETRPDAEHTGQAAKNALCGSFQSARRFDPSD